MHFLLLLSTKYYEKKIFKNKMQSKPIFKNSNKRSIRDNIRENQIPE